LTEISSLEKGVQLNGVALWWQEIVFIVSLLGRSSSGK